MGSIDSFRINDRVVVITGGAGLLGMKHAEAVIEGGGIPVLLDISYERLERTKASLSKTYGSDKRIEIFKCDITDRSEIESCADAIERTSGGIDVLINNAANDPKVGAATDNMKSLGFEDLSIEIWQKDLDVGLTGAFLCSQVFCKKMKEHDGGVVLNISSDLGLIAPDQRLYYDEETGEKSIKPVTYSVIKHGLIGLTRYLATYYAPMIRANALCPGGVLNGQDEGFLNRISNVIPMGRMADKDEYKSTVLYMISDASSYMTGSVVSVDGGRTCW